MTSDTSRTRPALSLPNQAGYGAAAVGIGAIEFLLQVYLLELYIVAGLNPSLAGLAIAIAVIWDALSDPAMGVLTDRSNARTIARKRTPYMYVGGAAIAISVALLFSPPANSAQSTLFTHLLIWYLIANTALTLFSVPYLTLVNDIGQSKDERAALFGSRLVFGSVGLLLGIGLPAYFASRYASSGVSETIQTRVDTGLTLALIAATLCFLSTASATRSLNRRNLNSTDSSSKSNYSLRKVLQGIGDRRFIYLALGFVLIAVGRSLNASLALPYYRNTLGFSETQIGAALFTLTIAIILAAALWVKLARKRSKQSLFAVAVALLAILSTIAYPLLPREILWPVLIVALIGGVLVASVVLLESLFSDFVESRKTKGASDSSGAFYGLWRMLSKVARALGIACSGLLLSAIGYQEATLTQSDSVERAIAWLFGPGVAVFFVLGAWTIIRAPRSTHVTLNSNP